VTNVPRERAARSPGPSATAGRPRRGRVTPFFFERQYRNFWMGSRTIPETLVVRRGELRDFGKGERGGPGRPCSSWACLIVVARFGRIELLGLGGDERQHLGSFHLRRSKDLRVGERRQVSRPRRGSRIPTPTGRQASLRRLALWRLAHSTFGDLDGEATVAPG